MRFYPARALGVAIAATLVLTALPAAAEFPEKTVQVILPFGSGPGDSMARIISSCVADRLKQPVIVVNRPGANAAIGANIVKTAAPDGYTLMYGASTTVTYLVTSKNPSYDVRVDLEPVSKTVFGIQGIYVNERVPAKTIPEFIAYAKANPGKLNYGTIGIGSVNHVTTEALSNVTGISMVHIPYAQGTGAFLAGLMGGEIQFATTDVNGAQPAVDSGKVRLIGIVAKERMPSRPDVPAIVEFYPEMAVYTGTLWYGFFAPPKTPAPIMTRLNKDIVSCMHDKTVRTALQKYGYADNQIVADSPEHFKAAIAEDIGRLRQIVERAKIPLR